MNQSALEGFVKIVEMDSFSAAAEALYLSQSALSQQIRTLEGQLQFERPYIRRQCAMPVRYSSRKIRRNGIWSLHGAMRPCGCSGTTCFL